MRTVNGGRGIMQETGCKKRLFTLAESAVYLGRSPYAVRSLVWGGTLPAVRNPIVGSKLFFDIRDLDNFIERNKTMEGA